MQVQQKVTIFLKHGNKVMQKKKTDEEGGVHEKNLIAVDISLAAENRELTGICC